MNSIISRLAFAVVLVLWAGVSSVLAGTPVAMVEESSNGVVGVGVFDMLVEGQTIDLGKDGVLILGYLHSCVHERIEGGLVTVGREQSEVVNGKVMRNRVECGGGNLLLTLAQSQASGAIALRAAQKPCGKAGLIHSTRPFILTRSSEEIVLSRLGNPADNHRLSARCRGEGRCGVDLAETDLALKPGASYRVRSGTQVVVFTIADDVVDFPGKEPVSFLGRIVFIR